ncbi:SCO4402 family protein [Streptomyces orinoci]|uniref:Uncharacterized protein n=1 Tax=Streptomyces orinoci TaxID=67339 RepID=A0ABV3K5F9_STRON|nr:hypothetical protein [Streptomyces orinoci]
MRDEVISAVRSLADREHQQRVWVERRFPHPGYFDDFSLSLNILDDATVLDRPHKAVGFTLRSGHEAEAMARLAERLDEVLRAVGRQEPDAAFLASPLWAQVVSAANDALHTLTC